MKMKRTLLFLLLASMLQVVHSQTTCIETVDIEDSNFEAYLENELGVGDGILDNKKVCKEEVEVLTSLNLSGSINLVDLPPGLGITDLTGIEFFTNLEVLRIEGNSINNVDLTQNTELKEIRAWRCNINTFNVQGLQNLELVGLNFNSISSINFSDVLALEILDITDNQLTSITLGNKPSLTSLRLSNNANLSTLDISGADSNLTIFNATSNTNLTCIQVSDVSNAEAQSGWLKDAGTEYNTNCSAPQPFTVSATISNAGTSPNYSIEEGSAFQLNFDTGTSGTNGLTYNPIITVTRNGVTTTEDFTIDDLDRSFTINTSSTDGNITFTANDDGVTEGDETYVITIASEDTNSYNIATPVSFEVTVGDKSPQTNNLVRAYLTNAGAQGDYSVFEGNTFRLNFEILNAQGVPPFYINTEASTASEFSEDSDFFMRGGFVALSSTDSDPDESFACSVFLDEFEDEGENIVIRLPKLDDDFEWENANADGSLEFTVRIEDRPQNYANAPISISLEGASGPPYSVTEGETLVFNINGTDPSFDGQSFTLFYSLEESTGFSDIGVNSTTSTYLLDLSVDNPDSTLEFEISNDQIANEGENLIITFLPEGNYDFENAASDGSLTFEIAINDAVNSPNPEANVEVKAFYRNATDQTNNPIALESSAPFRLMEGEGIDLSFELTNLSASITGSYGLRVETLNGEARFEDGDFEKIDEIIIVETNDSRVDRLPGTDTFNDLVEILNDGSFNEPEENFYIEITPVTANNIRLDDYVNSLSGELLAIGETLRFEVIIENGDTYGGEQFRFNITPRGDVTGTEVGNDLEIREGEILELWVDAETPNSADGFSFQLEPLFDPKFADDIEIIENNPIVVDNSKNPDGVIKIRIREDAIVDIDELIGIIFRRGERYTFSNLFRFNGDTFRYIPLTVKNVSTAEYYAIWDNKGSLEAGNDEEVITLELRNRDGTPFTTNTDLEFDVTFDTEVGDRNPADENEYPANNKITISSGQSSGSLSYAVASDEIEDNESEYYRALISATSGNNLDIELPEPLLIKILDNALPFTIFVQPKTNQSINPIYKTPLVNFSNASDCCPAYSLPEGFNYEVTFEAEKGVPEGEIYTVNVSYDHSNPGSSSTFAPSALEGFDFRNLDPDNSANYEVKLDKTKPDNTLIISIFDDEEETLNGNSPDELLEKFELKIALGENSQTKFLLQSVRIESPSSFIHQNGDSNFSMLLPFQNTDIFIKQVVPLTLEVVDNEINEESHQNDFAKIKVKRVNNSNNTIEEVNLVIYADLPEIDATENLDYEPIIKSINLGNDIEREILIKALQDEEVEGTEQIRIGLAPGNGYSYSSENIAIITITDEDVGEFDASIIVPEVDKLLYEDATLGPTNGVFEVTLNGETNTTAENLLVNFVINNDLVQPEEGIDYRIYDGNGTDRRDITNNTEKYVTIKPGETKGFIAIEVVQDDGIIEPAESIKIQLTSGINYNLINPREGTIGIISKEQDTSTLDPSNITAFVSSATCPGVEEGKIAMANSSPFDFMVSLYQASDTSTSIDSSPLTRNTVNLVELFDELKAGEYEIRLTIEDRSDILPPTFNLTVRENLESTGLLASSVDSGRKVANLLVSGSKFYQIESNAKTYFFEFDSRGPNKLQLPLQNGNNEITIQGEAPCQGKLQTNLLLANYKIFPNPTNSIINFNGFSPSSRIKMNLFDSTGKLVLEHEEDLDGSGNFALEIDFLPDGTYFGKIVTNGNDVLQIKLIKN